MRRSLLLLGLAACAAPPSQDMSVTLDPQTEDGGPPRDMGAGEDRGLLSRDLVFYLPDLGCPVAVIECPRSPYPVTPCEANNGKPLRDACGRYCVACGNGMDDCAFTIAGYQTICTGFTCPAFGLCFP